MSGPANPTNRPLRVLHVIPAVAPRYGGPTTNLWPMTKAIAESGDHVEIATTKDDGPSRLADKDLPADRVPTHLFDQVGDMRLWLREHANEYDLIHVHSLWNRAIAAGCEEAYRAGVPYVIRPCGMLSQYTWARSRLKKLVYWWLIEKKHVKRAAGYHATSAVEESDIRSCGVKVPIEVIPLGVEQSALDIPARPEWLRAKCGAKIAAETPIVLFLSRLHPKKGVADYLIPAFANLKSSAHLAIAGGVDDSTPGYGDEIRAAINRYNLGDRVSLIGPVAPADRWSAFDGAAVFCLPSQSENFGIVVAEAMARGCPVVVSERVDASDHVVAAGAGIKAPLNVDAISRALDQALADKSGMGEAGKKYVRDRLSWKPIGERIGLMYRRILGVAR